MSSDYSYSKTNPVPPPLNHTTHLHPNYPVDESNLVTTTADSENVKKGTHTPQNGIMDAPKPTKSQVYKAPGLRLKEAGGNLSSPPNNQTPNYNNTKHHNYESPRTSSYNHMNSHQHDKQMSSSDKYHRNTYNNDFRQNYNRRNNYSQQQTQQPPTPQAFHGDKLNSTPINQNAQKLLVDSKSNSPASWFTRNGRKSNYENPSQIFGSEAVHKAINLNPFDNIPVEITGEGASDLPPIEDFKSTQFVHTSLHSNLQRVGYSRLTPVQKHAIPAIANNRDLVACAQTGSGKTAAFLLPIISSMLKSGPPPHQPIRLRMTRSEPAVPICLVLSPTRELTLQIYQESRKFAFNTGIRTCVVYGGNDVRTQIFDLERGCDICVATPGRLKDLMERFKINLQYVKHLVLDEADRMLDMGFYPQMKMIILDSEMPSSSKGRQTVMFSATFPREVQQLAKEFLINYIFLSVGRVGSTNTFIRQKLQYVSEDQKLIYLLRLLKDTDLGRILIFVETKRKADQIEASLLDDDFKAVSIHGDKSQVEREDALRLFKDGSCRVMVATDVAARGLDIPNITHVINFDIPNNVDDYVHRIGRTGRAGNKGLATSFVNESNWPVFRDLINILEESKQEVPQWFQSLVMDTSYNRGRNKYNGGRNNHNNNNSNYAYRNSRDMRNTSDQAFYTHSKAGNSMKNSDSWNNNNKNQNFNGQYKDKNHSDNFTHHEHNAHFNKSNTHNAWKGTPGGNMYEKRWMDSDLNGGRDDAW